MVTGVQTCALPILVGVYTGVDAVVINFRQQTGQLSAEVLTLRDGVVISGMGTHGTRLA